MNLYYIIGSTSSSKQSMLFLIKKFNEMKDPELKEILRTRINQIQNMYGRENI